MSKKSASLVDKPVTKAFVSHLETDGIIQVIPEGLARKDKIVSMIINDLRGPLGALSGLLNLLHRDPEQTLRPDQLALIEQTQAISKALMRSSERLFHFYGARNFGLTPKSRFLDGHQLIQEAIQEANPLAQWQQVSLVNEMPEGARLFVDPVLMQEVILELLINAIRASKPYGQIKLSVSLGGPEIMIRVRDFGTGIAASRFSKLFTEGAVLTGYVADDERRKRGTGLGLPLAHRIVQAHGGRLEVESEEGKGSLFTVNLPNIRPRILLVDDQKMDLDLLTMYLEPLKMDVVQVKSGPVAIANLAHGARDARRGEGFDLIISDINMPVMDGFALLEQIMADPVTAPIPVILLTGEQSMAQRVKGFRMGAADFVLKPVQADEFRQRVRRLLGCLPES